MPKIVTEETKEDIRLEILNVAYKLIRKYGLTHTSIEKITKECNIGKGTFYLYFRSKEELVVALMIKQGHDSMHQFQNILNGREKMNREEGKEYIKYVINRPGIFAGSTLVFIWSFTELGTPLMFNYERVTAVQIYLGLSEMGNNPMPYALVTVMMLCAGLAYLVAKCWFGRDAYAMSGKAGRVVEPTRLTGWRNALAALPFAVVGLIGVLPHLGVLGMAVGKGWYRSVLPNALTASHFNAALGHNLTVPSIINSLRYAGFALAIALILGVFIAWVIVRGKGPARWLLDTSAMLPLAVPGLVMAFGYLAMTQKGDFFHFLNPIENPTILLVISYAIRRLPYVVRSAVAGLEQTSVSFEEAAASLGAKPMTTFRRITVPLIAANLLAGAILTFSFSMLEVSDSLILAQKAAYFPITKAIYELSSLLGQGPSLAAALGLWTMVFLGASFLLAAALLGKKLGAVFRG